MLKTIALGALALTLGAGAAQAAVVFSFVETGAGVSGTFSGSLDLTGAERVGTLSTGGSWISPDLPVLVTNGDFGGLSVSIVGVHYRLTSSPGIFGSGSFTRATGATGDLIGFAGNLNQLVLQTGYTSGSALSGTLIFGGATFGSLGVTPGSYVFSLPSDTITVTFGVTPVPLPASLPLLFAGLVGLSLVRRRMA